MSTDVGGAFEEIPEGCGVIGLLSSDEFLPVAEPFDRALLAVAGPRIGLVFAADPRGATPSAALATRHYRALGAQPVLVDVLMRDDARAEALPDVDILFLAGGSPGTLIGALRGTPFWDEASQRWRSGMALAGSSAGAMALCRHALVAEPGESRPTHWRDGLGPVERVALAVHANARPAQWLDEISAGAPVPIVALDEGVGVVLRAGAEPVVAGHGRAWIVS